MHRAGVIRSDSKLVRVKMGVRSNGWDVWCLGLRDMLLTRPDIWVRIS